MGGQGPSSGSSHNERQKDKKALGSLAPVMAHRSHPVVLAVVHLQGPPSRHACLSLSFQHMNLVVGVGGNLDATTLRIPAPQGGHCHVPSCQPTRASVSRNCVLEDDPCYQQGCQLWLERGHRDGAEETSDRGLIMGASWAERRANR